MVRFCGQATVVQVTLPYTKIESYPNLPSNNFIDEKLISKWKDLGLTPSPPVRDEEFLRRIYLDAIGTLPTPEEVRGVPRRQGGRQAGQGDRQGARRPEFVDFWALKWGDLLRINRDVLQEKGMWSFHNWVRAALRDNKPVDEMVRDIITAEGSTFTEGPANYYQRRPHRRRLGRDDRAALPRRPHAVRQVPSPPVREVEPGRLLRHGGVLRPAGHQEQPGVRPLRPRDGHLPARRPARQTHPRKGGVVKPHPLDGPDDGRPVRPPRKLADWLTAQDNPFFARNLVNRFWGYLMGRGLVEPLDDMRATNPASNPELLDALAEDFVEHKFDLKHLLRTILNSRAYQLELDGRRRATRPTRPTSTSRRYTVKRLTAEQLADAIDFATGTREKYPGLPLGTRAIQLPDTRGAVVPAGRLRPAAAADHLRVRADRRSRTSPRRCTCSTATSSTRRSTTRPGRVEKLLKAKADRRRRSRSCTW